MGRSLDILLYLAQRPGPVQAAALARDLRVPRSSIYHILSVLVDRGFVVYLPDAHGYGLGVSSFEIGSAYLRHEPLERLAQPIAHRLAMSLGLTVHLGVLHGNETLYLLKERPTSGPAAEVSLITDIGVRLPAHLTANGRAILSALPDAQLSALYSRRGDLVTRTGRGPRSLTELRFELAGVRRRGWADEVEHVTVGLRSVGAAVFDHQGRPVAALSTTFSAGLALPEPAAVGQLLRAGASRLTERISGHAPAPG